MNRFGALAAMLTGVGVTVVWKLGRDAATAPESFSRAGWAVVIVGAAILVLGRLRDSFEVGDRGAVLTATAMTLGAWFLVPRWGLDQLYELVPAFILATAAGLAVSRLLPDHTLGGGVMPKDSRT
jgi:Na+/proline symporter